MNTTYSLVCGLAEILHTADFQEANQQAALQADHRQQPVAVYAHLNSGEQMLMALIQPNRLNQLDLLAEYTMLSGIAHHHRINSNGGAKP